MNAPKTRHFLMLDQRTLCDRFSESETSDGTADTPLCGACLVLLHGIRSYLAIEQSLAPGVWPATAGDAYRTLTGTRWAAAIDIDKVAHDHADLRLDTLLTAEIPQESVDRAAAHPRGRATIG